jgi:adenine-specific DNA-methyltransferase
VCEAIVERYYSKPRHGRHRARAQSCGDGRFLLALPDEVAAIGVEIDPELAQRARELTGRQIITGDFLNVDIAGRVTHVIGNPPFESSLVHRFMQRAHGLLEPGGSCGLLLPAYVLQTSSKVAALNRDWSISCELMPRNVFPRLRLPLVFAMFRKDYVRSLVGFFLYREAHAIAQLPNDVREALNKPARGSVWRTAVRTAFSRLQATQATLEQLYAIVERPSKNHHWREKVRQTLQVYPEFKRAGPGTWAIAEAA